MQSICGTIEILDPAKFRRENERALKSVSPTMIGTTEMLRFSLGLCHNSSGVMAADVEKAAQYAVVVSDDDKRLAGDFRGDVSTGLANLIGTADELPRAKKNGYSLQLKNLWTVVPNRGGRG